MKYINNLILLLMFSALACSAQASHVAAVDGYLDQTPAQPSVVSQSELESDTPDKLLSSSVQTGQRPLDSEHIEFIEVALCSSNYQDFFARAPPHA